MKKFRRLSRGQKPTAEEWNALLTELERLGKWKVSAPLELRNNEGGFTLAYAGRERSVVVKITGNAAGGGKYVGKIHRLPTEYDPATNYESEDMGALPGSNDCHIINGAEEDQSTHDLFETGTPETPSMPGVIIGAHTDGKPIVAVFGYVWKNCA